MCEQLLYFSGVDPRGKYLTLPITAEELAEQIKLVGLKTPPSWVLEQAREHPVGDPRRRPIQDAVRKWDLTETGWAVVFAPGIDRRVRRALEELLEHRRNQATRNGQGRTDYYRCCDYRAGEATLDFLHRHGASAGSRGDPDFFPYYILLVGDPEDLPYSFQQELDVTHAVGRICFDQPQDYAAYAKSVVRAETRPPARPRRVGFFGTAHENDPATQRMAGELVQPLSEAITEPGWEVERALGLDARKERLRELLGGGRTPALLFAACHGLGYLKEDERQRDGQGALVCQDWPGPKSEEGVGEKQCFSAADVDSEASLHGLIAFFVACYGVGTPARDSFDQNSFGDARPIAPRAFPARLPQRLLSHCRGGALAVVGHVDRAWTTSFAGSEKGEGRGPFLYTLRRLLEGHTVGWAIEDLNLMYASLATQLSTLWESWHHRKEIDHKLFSYLWRYQNDARNYTVFGDPAVRLPGVGEPR